MTERKGPVDSTRSRHARWRTLPLTSVQLDGGFWADRQAVNRRSSLVHAYRMLKAAGNFHNLRVAAGRANGDYRGRNFLDSDVYKWLEAVAYELAKAPDATLRQMAEEAIDLIAAAQTPDGYLNTYVQIVTPDSRFSDLDHGHELYCAGHLFQAAVAYHRATGSPALLDVATRFADYIDGIFGPGKRPGTDGHPEVEMALVELYRETGEARYLKLAQFFVDERGKGKMRGLGWYGPEYHQDRVPVRQATEIEGHAVRALYLMAGVTDLYLETGEQALLDAANRLWRDMTGGKLHLTGGAGARYEGESFGAPYELPSDQCYCETCAAIASIQWNWRMLLATGEARFADLLEQTLYNGFLSGVAADGEHFFYINPLLSRGGYERAAWYEVACCPPNIMRTVASVEHYLATTDASGVQVHLYSPASVSATLESGERVALRLETQYPWQGHVALTIVETGAQPWTLRLRIPGWQEAASIRVNGQAANTAARAGTYALIVRAWQPGDRVELDLPMPPQLLEAHPQIDATRASAAIRRGPLVYCLEQRDQDPDVDIFSVQIDARAPLEAAWNPDLLGGMMVVNACGHALDMNGWAGHLYRPLGAVEGLPRRPVQLRAVPYFAWANRGARAMRVWIPRAADRDSR
ncbi:MAG: glycoside hydrolase family 127 protein [Anaerolineae bacterium]|nr:glycoside hydrolase family 127 protein [Anaerolineae bacterium]